MNRMTRSERYNARMDKIFAEARKRFAERNALALLKAAEKAFACLNRPEAERNEQAVRLHLEYVIARTTAGWPVDETWPKKDYLEVKLK